MPMQISGVTIQGGMNILPRAGAPSPSPTPGPTPGPSDPDFSNVVFMFDGDGTSGDDNNTFTDSSTNAHAITKNGDVTQGSFSPYGDNWSNYFDGNDHLNTPSVTFGTNNFTIEAWVMFDNASAAQNPIIVLGDDGYNDWQLDTDSSNIRFQHTSGSFSGTTTLQDNTWYHVAVVREGTGTNQIKMYLNGALEATSTVSENFNGTGNIKIARNRGNSYYMSGYISNVRLVNGTAVYTSAFTPSTSPLTAITNTELLTCQSNRFVDESTNNHAVTVNGDTKVTPFSPFKNDDARDITTDGGSFYIDGGSGDGLTIATDTTLDITGDFTIECWYYNRNTALYAALFGSSDGNAGNETKIMFDLGTDEINFQYPGGNIGATGGKNSEWNHIAVTRSGSTTRLFLNGNLEESTNSSYTFTTGQKWIVGNRPPSAPSLNYPFTGFISDARCIKGTALYTSSFTPPTSPLTAVTNTELLLNFQDSGIYDRTGLNNIDTVGNAQIDTAIKKYGTGSMQFGGTTDRLITLGPDLLLGTGDFTIEFWVYFNSVSDGNIYTILDGRTTSDTSNVMWAQESNGAWTIFNGAGSSLNEGWASNAFTTGVWYHLAQTRESGVSRFFKDGTQTSGDLSDTSDYNSSTYSIGGRYSPSAYSLDGYIDDFRITKGVARYTSNFTAPTAALPKF
ncbi:MAG: LamG domain-containing protein [Gammaproteobacteria bacterium]|nr:LamG domain-containing protein [Gammaproteobacteria bacterium]